MAGDLQLDRRHAVLMWAKDKLPEQLADAISIGRDLKAKDFKRKKLRFSLCDSDDDLRKAIIADKSSPFGLVGLAQSDNLWALYQPTCREVEILFDLFALPAEGEAGDYCDALRLIREFRGKKT